MTSPDHDHQWTDDPEDSHCLTCGAKRHAPHPGESHEFRTTCIHCGGYGQLFVAVLGPDERARIEPIDGK